MADGYGFGGEGDWKTSVLVRTLKVMAQGLPGGTSFMEDYTYHLEPGNELVLGAHMLEVCPTLSTAPARVEIHPLGIGGREDPVRLVFDADPGEAVLLGMSDLGDRFRLVGNEVTVVPAARRTCRSCRWAAPSGAPSRTSRPRPRAGCSPAARTTRSCRPP